MIIVIVTVEAALRQALALVGHEASGARVAGVRARVVAALLRVCALRPVHEAGVVDGPVRGRPSTGRYLAEPCAGSVAGSPRPAPPALAEVGAVPVGAFPVDALGAGPTGCSRARCGQ